jgi:hypothetical protein
MSRREWAASLGASGGAVLARWAWSCLAADPLWAGVAAAEPQTGRYLAAVLLLPLPLVGAILACALINFAEVHGFASVPRRRPRPLRPYPFDPTKTQLVIGETHEQDGGR